MPAKSQAQFRLMAAAASSPKTAKKLGVPQSAGKEFVKATKSVKSLPRRAKAK